MRPRFNYAHMRAFLYSWHGGQWSSLYGAASSGLVSDIETLSRELIGIAEWCEQNKGVQAKTASDARFARKLADALPLIIKNQVIINGKAYGILPWCGRA